MGTSALFLSLSLSFSLFSPLISSPCVLSWLVLIRIPSGTVMLCLRWRLLPRSSLVLCCLSSHLDSVSLSIYSSPPSFLPLSILLSRSLSPFLSLSLSRSLSRPPPFSPLYPLSLCPSLSFLSSNVLLHARRHEYMGACTYMWSRLQPYETIHT